MKRWAKVILFFVFIIMGERAWAQVIVDGNVFEQDDVTPIESAVVTFSGISELGDTIVYQFVTDSLGHYSNDLAAGFYSVCASAEGYATGCLSDSLYLTEGQTQSAINFSLHELYYPVRYVAARQFTNDLVRLTWSMHEPLLFEDFETGDFSHFNWNNNLSNYPWVIDTLHVYEGLYCMKSTCESVSEGISQIEVSVYVPLEGLMSFYSKISSENPWDMGRFYLDGVKKMECSGEEEWTEHQFDISVGEHVFRWEYVKDGSTDVGDDCFFVDCIRFYHEEGVKSQCSFQYYDLFRNRYGEEPVMMASHLNDTMFMDMSWNSLPWGQYRWGVSCHYEGNRSQSDTVWSAYLDKDMTTTFILDATTNVGLSPVGAVVTLLSHSGQGFEYQATLDANGHLLLPTVYRDEYNLRVHLEGFVDYVSDSPVSIFSPTQIEIELEEATPGVDSLYVSSTGWAMWSLDESQQRDLQYFEVLINGEMVGQTSNTSFQFDVSDLSEGDICTAQVRPVYLSGTCDWKSYQWIYQPCSTFIGSTNMVWVLNNEDIFLSWVYPEGDLLGAMLFRDGEFLGFTEEDTFLDETVELHGEVTYCLRLVYDGALDGTYYSMSCEQCITASFPAYCDPPVKMDGMVYYEDENDHGALISWGERPDPINQWLYYDDGMFKRSLGGEDEPRIFWAVRFEAEDLDEYIGTALKKVSLYDVAAGTYQLWVYVGGENAPHTLVRSQNMTLIGSQAWHEEAITPAFIIPENEPLWIVIGQQGLARPAAACQDMGASNGRWVSLDGETWTDMHNYNMHYTWMIRAFVTNVSGHMVTIGKEGYTLQHYNLYRSYDNTEYEQVASISAIEGQLYYEYRDNLADEDPPIVYYRLTAYYLTDDGEICESDFATTLNDPELDYVSIDLTSTKENHDSMLKLYPNPTNGFITIELKEMQKVMVYDIMGKTLLNKEVNNDCLLLDVSHLEDGLYWLRVGSQNGVVTRRFVLTR